MRKLSMIILAGVLVLAVCLIPIAAVSAKNDNSSNSPNSFGFMTGGGKVIDAGGGVWTVSGNIKDNGDGTGSIQFQITDHAGNVSWHCDEITSLALSGDPIEEPNGPDAGFSVATFTGNFTGNTGLTVVASVVITDVHEPGNGNDTIVVTGGLNFGGTLSGGNFQAHKGQGGGR